MQSSWAQHDTVVAQRSRRSVVDLFRESGEIRQIEGNEPFLIADPAMAWLVDVGALDLFFVDVIDKSPIGRRHHFVRIEETEMVLGVECLPASAPDTSFGLLAVPVGGGTRIVSLDQAELRARAEKLGCLDAVHGLIDTWVRRISKGLRRQDLPRDAGELQPGVSTDLEPGASARSGPKTIWFRQVAGVSKLVGVSSIKPASDWFLPLTRETWIEAETKVSLRVVDAATYFRWDPKWASLRRTHRLILDCVARSRALEHQAEQQRLALRGVVEDRALNSALFGLSAVDQEGEAAADEHPMIAACRKIGAVYGTKIVVPARVSGGQLMLSDIARASRLRERMVVLSGEWWKQSGDPMLGFAGDPPGPVALLPRAFGGYDLYDPVTRTRRRAGAEGIVPFAFALYRPFPARALNLFDLMRFAAAGNTTDIIVMIGAGVFLGLLAMIIPYATGQIIDFIIPSAEVGLLIQTGVALAVVAMAGALVQLARGAAALRIETRMGSGTEAAVWDRLLALPVSFFRKYSAGDLAIRANGIETIRQALSGNTLGSILTSIFALMNFVVMLAYDATLAAVALGLSLGSVLIALLIGVSKVFFHRELAEAEGRLSSLVLQLLGGITKLRIAGAEQRAFGVWAKEFARKRSLSIKVRKLENWMGIVSSLYPTLMTMVIFYLVSETAKTNGLSTGRFLAFYASFGIFVGGLVQLVAQGVDLLNLVPVYERARALFETVPEVDDLKADPGDLQGSIQVSHVGFRYAPDGPLVLDDVDFDIAPGEMVAIVGASASGKSTLLRMMLGFERPDSGGIFFDRQELSSLDVTAVRRQIGVVLQNGSPIAGSLLENIVGSRQLPPEAAWEAARMAGFDEDIRRMPMGMQTVIGQGGFSLSGGQRQRLLIARAIVNRPRIIFFDEATSALDNKAQAVVTESLERLHATRIVIAHRLSTIRNADKIIVLERGRVVESGNYEELMAKEGVFQTIARRQIS